MDTIAVVAGRRQPTSRIRHRRLLGAGLILLGGAVAGAAVLGPLALGVLRYRTSPTTLNQIVGGDAAMLAVVAPLAVLVGVLAVRGHPAAPVLALAPSVVAAYTYTQLIVGNEYLRLPGNVERFFPLLLGLFVLSVAIAVSAWSDVPPRRLPATSKRADRIAGVLLLVIAVFVVVGLHLPTYLDALREQPTAVQYLSSPTPFWLVKLMDLGIVAPAAAVVGIGSLRRRAWARKPMYVLLGGYTLLSASVAGMAVTMYLRRDPDASAATVIGSMLLMVALVAVTGYLYRPLFAKRAGGPEVRPAVLTDPVPLERAPDRVRVRQRPGPVARRRG